MHMIDFKNGEFVKLRKVGNGDVGDKVLSLLVPGEEIIGTYKGVRDYVTFTDRRFFAVNLQGLTGKKQDITSMSYKGISVFSIETAGHLDLDSELEVYYSGVGKLRFEFNGSCDITAIGRCISGCMS
ncbi:MAG: PH domain-containing protein [Candidatus Methanomethylophilaceae archaeon]|nr:PH domain-containing protein [Candidatus Methanomethylophilaceae archaeon]